jgi:hypothetical protein
MPFNKTLAGPQLVSKRVLAHDVLAQDGFGPTFGLTQPANSVVESVFIRVLKAPSIATGCSIGFEAGTDADIDNIVDQSGDDDASDNILDAASDDPATIPVNTIYKIDGAADAHFGFVTRDFATGDAATEGASEIVTENTDIQFRFRLSDHAITTNMDCEVSFTFRVFE